MLKHDHLRQYPIRLVFILSSLGAASSLNRIIAFNINIPFHWFMLALALAACTMPLIDFNKLQRATLAGIAFRLILAAVIGFCVFFHDPIWVRIVITVYSFVLLSVLSSAMTEGMNSLNFFCVAMILFNIVAGMLSRRTIVFEEYGQHFDIIIAVSLFAVLTFFLVSNVNTARWFGVDRLKLPSTIKRLAIMVLAAVGVLIALVSLAPWIARGLDALYEGAAWLIGRFLDLFTGMQDNVIHQPLPPVESQPLVPLEPPPQAEPGVFEIILHWLSIILFIALAAVAVIAILAVLVKLTIQLYRYLMRRGFRSKKKSLEDDVFTEVIEKIAPDRKKWMLRRMTRQPGYSSLLTEHERIVFIYREYVRRAKRKGFTHDQLSDTSNDILEEITMNINKDNFPPPEGLNDAFNTARYSNDQANMTGADELKRRLL